MKSLILATFVFVIFGQSLSLASAELDVCVSEEEPPSTNLKMRALLPKREGVPVLTSGRVPHVQIDIEPVSEINQELYRLAFALPGVKKRPTIVSLPGTDGMWLSDHLAVAYPKAIVAGREFAHIHPDGSLHAPLPFQRALEITEKGWGERHPWADRRQGWEGLVMIYTPQTEEQLAIVFQLIVESYNYVTGKRLQISTC